MFAIHIFLNINLSLLAVQIIEKRPERSARLHKPTLDLLLQACEAAEKRR